MRYGQEGDSGSEAAFDDTHWDHTLDASGESLETKLGVKAWLSGLAEERIRRGDDQIQISAILGQLRAVTAEIRIMQMSADMHELAQAADGDEAGEADGKETEQAPGGEQPLEDDTTRPNADRRRALGLAIPGGPLSAGGGNTAGSAAPQRDPPEVSEPPSAKKVAPTWTWMWT